MSLAAGTKFGPYEIIAPLGAGGMGEVYKAKDTRLDRTVAIKVLSAQLTGNTELKARFEREARTISQLNHPHICTLHDVGHDEASHADFLVMEFIEGETLADRLERGAMPVLELIRTGSEIADALDKAHRAGIVHRDLKPGNVMLTKTGAKLLDFGLAKPAALGAVASGSAPLLSAAMTMTSPAAQASPLTSVGALVGTVQYMSPEQLQGIEADARSDIFSLGCVLYEMASGRRAFEGKSQIKVASAILEDQPTPLSSVQTRTPAALERAITTCLNKNPEERFQCARDLKLQLQWIGEGGASGASASSSLPSAAQTSGLWKWATIAVFLVLVAGAVLAWMRWPQPMSLQASILPPDKTGFTLNQDDSSGTVVLSHDGRQMAFVGLGDNNETQIYVRALNEPQAHAIPGTQGAIYPFWSFDDKSLGFVSNAALRRVDLGGGPTLEICSASRFRGGMWTADNTIYFAPDVTSAIYRVAPTPGATPVQVTTLAAEHTTNRWPFLLPDGKHMLYLASNHSDPGASANNGIYFSTLDGKQSHFVVSAESNAEYVNGYLLWAQTSSLLAQRFDPATGQLSGSVTALADGIGQNSSTWRAAFDANANGVLVYQPGQSAGDTKLRLLDANGNQTAEIDLPALDMRISPDGHKAAIVSADATHNVWLLDLDNNTRVRFNFTTTNDGIAWSPDSRYLYYANISRDAHIYRKPVDGSGPEQLVYSSNQAGGSALHVSEISSDGHFMLIEQRYEKVPFAAWIVPLNADGSANSTAARPLLPEPTSSYVPRFSPDGKWVAYVTAETGRNEVYVVPTAGGAKQQLSNGGGAIVGWRADGKAVLYYLQDGSLMELPIQISGNSLQPGKARLLFKTPRLVGTSFFNSALDTSRDGRRFLMNVAKATANDTSRAVLITNWQARLKK